MVGTCKLCGKHGTLRHSHILPEFLYKDLYDKKHRFNVITTGGKPKRPTEQKGVREYLLCQACETKLSKYEKHASIILGGKRELLTDDPRGFEFKVEYERFKLFELSLLWRVGISSDAAFKEVVLGQHEAQLREMLLNEISGKTAEYGCIVVETSSFRDMTNQLIMSFGAYTFEGTPVYPFVFGRWFWLFFLSRTSSAPDQEELFLQETGEFRVLRGNFGFGKWIIDLALELYQNNPQLHTK